MVLLRPRPVPRTTMRMYAAARQPGPTSQFYKTFARPVAKVLVLAVFTYQLAYWGWAKLEAEEHRSETQATIARLEAEVGAYAEAKSKQAARDGEAKAR
ncbi:hypothetical protein CDD83_932 [Cordyceps sp. RAO-2017]|nr:hypothetical protein CDD83_932 [Cordyceps sp. RAO-2017]